MHTIGLLGTKNSWELTKEHFWIYSANKLHRCKRIVSSCNQHSHCTDHWKLLRWFADHGDKTDFNKEKETQNLQRYRHREAKFCARHDNCGNTMSLSVGDLLHSRQLHWAAYCVRLTSILNACVDLGCILKQKLFSPAGAMVELLLVSVPASTPTE